MFGKTLASLRRQLGFSSARSFYYDHLSQKLAVPFTYIYYTKMEAGTAIPSPEVVEAISSSIEDIELSKRLIYSYCQNLFPRNKQFFQIETVKVREERAKDTEIQRTVQKQKNLTYLQIDAITRTAEHYLIFMIITLARTPINIKDLEEKYGIKNAAKISEELSEVQILKIVNEKIVSFSKELVFPKDVPVDIQKKYDLIDQWTATMGSRLKLDSVYDKMITRRISHRYKDLIYTHIDLLINLIRASDETNQDMNDHVIQFSLSLKDGKVIG